MLYHETTWTSTLNQFVKMFSISPEQKGASAFAAPLQCALAGLAVYYAGWKPKAIGKIGGLGVGAKEALYFGGPTFG